MDVPADPLAAASAGRTRLLIGNLDAELSWAKARLATHARLPNEVLAAISAAGACMAVLGRPGDVLWLPVPIASSRLGPLLEQLQVELISGPLANAPRLDEVVPWGWTTEIEQTTGLEGACPAIEVAKLNDRCTSLEIEHEMGWSIGTQVIRTQDQLTRALEVWPHPAPWVLKAPLSASGRSRLKRRGEPESDARTRAKRLLDRFGVLLLEPWLPRERDWGTVGIVGDEGDDVFPPHALMVDGNGVFRAIELDVDSPPEIASAAELVARRLRDAGYRGPFGVDSFAYSTAVGSSIRQLCEINTRLSFGHLAHAANRRFRDQLSLGPGAHLRLDVTRDGAVPEGAHVLVAPSSNEPTAVFLTSSPSA